MLVDWQFFQIFTFIGSSVICLSLSEIPIWTHQREFGLSPETSTKLYILGGGGGGGTRKEARVPNS